MKRTSKRCIEPFDKLRTTPVEMTRVPTLPTREG
jgi:hypothetical protein